MREIFAVYRSGVVVWLVPYLYWVSFGTLTFFASAMPTYLVDRWHVDAARASMVYTPLLVVCVAITRPLGGWLADRFDVLAILSWLFGMMVVLALVMAMQISLNVELFAIYGLALLSGAAAAAVIKLIPMYFLHVGAVSGLGQGRRRGLRLHHDHHPGRQQLSSGRLHLGLCHLGADEHRRVLRLVFARRLQACKTDL